jgi:hypothetical protein
MGRIRPDGARGPTLQGVSSPQKGLLLDLGSLVPKNGSQTDMKCCCRESMYQSILASPMKINLRTACLDRYSGSIRMVLTKRACSK